MMVLIDDNEGLTLLREKLKKCHAAWREIVNERRDDKEHQIAMNRVNEIEDGLNFHNEWKDTKIILTYDDIQYMKLLLYK